VFGLRVSFRSLTATPSPVFHPHTHTYRENAGVDQ